MEEKNVQDRAADKLGAEMAAVAADKGLKGFEATAVKYLAKPIGDMLTKFCYQNEEFALAVERCDKPLMELLRETVKMSTRDKPGVSDVEAYVKAVKFYLPAAEVICSFRVNLPEERDEDLLDLENVAEPEEQHKAMILDLFGTEEE